MSVKFEDLPLLRSFTTLDMEEGQLYLHEVRRDPTSGLTLTRKKPVTEDQPEKGRTA